jgi:hypothetical protein
MSVLSIILAVLLAGSVAGNVFQFFTGVEISQKQEQTVQTYNINENGNVNINNYGQSINGDKIHFEIVTIQDTHYLTNYLMTLDNFTSMNCRIVRISEAVNVPHYILFIPVIGRKVTTNSATLTNTQSSEVFIGWTNR